MVCYLLQYSLSSEINFGSLRVEFDDSRQSTVQAKYNANNETMVDFMGSPTWPL